MDMLETHRPSSVAGSSVAFRQLGKAGLVTLVLAGLLIGCRSRSLPEPGLRLGSDAFERTGFAQVPAAGSVSDLRRGVKGRVIAAGANGAATLTEEGDLISFVPFEVQASNFEILDVEGDGRLDFLNRGGGWQPVWLLGPEGDYRWRHELESAPNGIAAGDLDGDGIKDFVVGYNGSGGLRRLDAEGEVQWRVEGSNIWHVEIADLPDSGPTILHSDVGSDRLIKRSPDGSVLEIDDDYQDLSDFVILTGPDDKLWLVHHSRGDVVARHLDGTREIRFSRLGSLHPYRFTAAFVDFGHEDKPRLAVLVGGKIPYRYHDFRTDLEIYEWDGTGVYHEVLDGWWLDLEPHGTDLLLGGPGRVDVLRFDP